MSGYQNGGYPPGPQATAALYPPESVDAYQRMVREGQAQVSKPAWPVNFPTPWLYDAPGIGTQLRIYGFEDIVDQPVGTEIIRTLRFDIPVSMYRVVGAASFSDGTALPNGQDPLSCFSVRFMYNQDNLTVNSILASCILGTGADGGGLLGGPGWVFTRGSVLQVGVTPRRADLRISIAGFTIEQRGPVNFNPMG